MGGDTRFPLGFINRVRQSVRVVNRFSQKTRLSQEVCWISNMEMQFGPFWYAGVIAIIS